MPPKHKRIRALKHKKPAILQSFACFQDIPAHLMLIIGSILILTSGLFNAPAEILSGLNRILLSPSVLISDYIIIGNLGAAFVNSGSLIILATLIAVKCKAEINGPLIAAIMIIGGFAFFGKNLLNVWAIMLGVVLYARFKKESFRKYIAVAFFGTALAPLVSLLAFGYGWPLTFSLPLGYLAGMAAGFVLPPLAAHFLSFHQGFNLYNIGFTAGIVGMVFKALLRGFDLNGPQPMIIATGYNLPLGVFLYCLYTGILVLGLCISQNRRAGLLDLWAQSGRLGSDYTASHGIGLVLINMAFLGYTATSYVLLVGGELNGPVLGGIFTVVGFGGFGKHLRNVLPILAGVYLATFFKIWDPHATSALLSALFGTALAPIAGAYGWRTGLLAGFIHMSVVMNIGYLHGGINLYNNGFSCGFVAAALIPVLESLKAVVAEKKTLPANQEALQPAAELAYCIIDN